MKLQIRRVGNSLGEILPQAVLTEWGVGEGDALELRHFSPKEVRAQSLANLHRWKGQGTWVSAYDEWTEILQRGSDGELFNAMLGRNDNSNRLRQSIPYVGLLSQEEVKNIYEEAGAFEPLR
jgi:hypothetical protein